MSQVVVIDNGSGLMKVGRGNEKQPRLVFQSIVGHARYSSQLGNENVFVGDSMKRKRGILDLHYPFDYGAIDNFDDMKEL